MIVKLPCNCRSAHQDQVAGRGLRFHNVLKNPSKARCTVCNTTHDVPGVVQKEVKKEGKKKDA